MATDFPIPWGCCSIYSASPPILVLNPATSLSPLPRPVTHHGLFPGPRAFPFSWGCCAALATRPSLSRSLFPSSRVYTPPGRQQPFGAGPLDPHPSGDSFMRLARVAPFPPPSLSPVTRPDTNLGLFPASRAFPFLWGCCEALATRPSLSRPLLPSSHVYTPPGRQQPCGAGPLDSHPSGDRFMRLARVALIPPPSLSPVTRLDTHLCLFCASRPFPVSWGCCAALATRPSLFRPLFPSSPVYTPLGRQQPFGAGPLDPHPSADRFLRLAWVAPLPPPFVWVVGSFLDLLGALLPGPAPASPSTRVYSPPGHLRFFFFARNPRPLFCTLCSFPFPCCLLALCFTPSGAALLFLFWSAPLPLSRCASCLVGPSSLHTCTSALHWSSGHGSPRCSSPVQSPSWGVPLGGPRPCQVGAPASRHSPLFPLFSPLPSPPFTCLSSALLVLLSSSVCSLLVFPAPQLYLVRSHTPLGLRPVP